MATQKLLFGSADGTTLFSGDGTTVTQLANDFSSPAFLADPLYGKVSTALIGTTVYFTMTDTAGATSAIWQYNGTALTQITASSSYVFNQTDLGNAVAPQALSTYNGDRCSRSPAWQAIWRATKVSILLR
jgi:hypothetical protein